MYSFCIQEKVGKFCAYFLSQNKFGVAIDTGSSVARPAKNCLLTPAGGINHHENAAATEDTNSLTNINLAHPL